MKIVKIAAITMAAMAAIAAAAVLYILSPSFQTAQANAFLAELMPNSKIGSLSIGFGGLSAEDVDITLPTGDKFQAKKASAKYSLSKLLSKKIDIQDIQINGAKLDIAKERKAAAPAAESKVSTKGSSQASATPKKADIGFEIILANADADAEISIPDGSKIKVAAKISSLKIASDLIPSEGTVSAKINAEPKNLAPEEFLIKATCAPSVGGISVKLLASRKDADMLKASAIINKASFDADFEARLDVNDSQISPLLNGIAVLPQFSSSIYAAGKSSKLGSEISAKVVFKNSASNLKNVSPALGFLGKCGLDGEIAIEKKASTVSVSKLDITFTESSDAILALSSSKAFSIDTQDLSKLPEGDLAVVSLAVPARFAAAFADGIDIRGDDIRGKISLARGMDNSISIKTISPIVLSSWNISKGGEYLLKDFNARLTAQASSNLKGKYDISSNAEIADSKEHALNIYANSKIDADDIDAQVLIKGSLNPIISRVNSISSFNSAGLKIDAEINARKTGNMATLKSAKIEITENSERKVVEITDGGEISFDMGKKALSAPSKTLIKISAPDFPFALAKPFVSGLDAQKVSIESQLEMPDANNFKVCADFSAKSVSYKKDGKFLLKSLSPSVKADAKYNVSTGVIEAKIEKLILNSGVDFATAEGSASFDAAKKHLKDASLKANIALPQLLEQPALLKFANISTGTLEVDAKGSANSCSISAQIHNLMPRASQNGKLEKAAINANAKFDGGFSKIYLTADLSANSTNGSTSAKAILEQTEDTKLDLDIKSAVFEDISLLTSAFSNPNEKAATAVANANSEKVAVVRPKSLEAVSPEQNIISDAKDEKAFWDIGRCLYANVKLGRLLKDGAAMLENLSANAECTPGNLALKDFVGKLYSAEFSGSANLSFDKSRKAPYNLANTRISLKNLESSKLFADSEKPMITGEFSAQLDLEGSGNNMKHLGAYLLGSASLSGSGGTLRLIDTSTQEGALTSIAGSAMRIAGMFLKDKAYEVGAMGDIIGYFGNLKYNGAEIKAKRNPETLAIELSAAEVKTEALILAATGGSISMTPNVAIKEQPINIPISIKVADGSVRKMFQKLNFGSAETDTKGFFNGPSFTVTGTIGAPKTSLRDVLLSAEKSSQDAKIKAAQDAQTSESPAQQAVKSSVPDKTPDKSSSAGRKSSSSPLRSLIRSLRKDN